MGEKYKELYDNELNRDLFNSITPFDKEFCTIHYADFVKSEIEEEIPTLSMKVFSKTTQMSDNDIKIPTTRHQMAHFQEYENINLDEQFEAYVKSEFRSQLSRKAINKMFEFGQKNFENTLKNSWKPNIAPESDSVSREIEKQTKVNFWPNPFKWFLNIFKRHTIVVQEPMLSPVHQAQRKLISKLLQLSNYIAVTSRRGPATTAIVNGLIGTALADSAMFTVHPVQSVNNITSNVYAVGSIAGIKIMVDPNMKWNDTRILVYRKGSQDEPGLHLTYLQNYGLQTVVEGTSAPRACGKFAIFEAGFKPELNYIVAPIEVPSDLIF